MIGAVVTKYRGSGEGRKTYREFASEIGAFVPGGLSYTTIHNWERGKSVNPRILALLAGTDTGWVRDFARDALAALDAEVERRR
jgi:hypothetical protein